MRIVTTLPAATEIVCALGLQDQLLAVSHECHFPDGITVKPRATVTNFDFDAGSSLDIDIYVRTTLREGLSLYCLDDGLLAEIQPTHLITQELCEVCAITPDQVQTSIKKMLNPPKLLSLGANSISTIYNDISRAGSFLGRNHNASNLIKDLRQRLTEVTTRTLRLAPVSVFCVEWLNPLFTAGHWVPEMVRLAGGCEVIGVAGQRSVEITWGQVAAADPEILVLMPCGFEPEKTLNELPALTKLPLWSKLRAVKNRQVWILSGPDFFSQSGPRLISEGIPLLAKVFHPKQFGKPNSNDAINIMD